MSSNFFLFFCTWPGTKIGVRRGNLTTFYCFLWKWACVFFFELTCLFIPKTPGLSIIFVILSCLLENTSLVDAFPGYVSRLKFLENVGVRPSHSSTRCFENLVCFIFRVDGFRLELVIQGGFSRLTYSGPETVARLTWLCPTILTKTCHSSETTMYSTTSNAFKLNANPSDEITWIFMV